jgi:hypothetical protein
MVESYKWETNPLDPDFDSVGDDEKVLLEPISSTDSDCGS